MTAKNEFFATSDKNISGWSFQIDKENCILTASHEITNDIKGKTIMFYTDDAYVDAYVGNKTIYHFGEKNFMGTSPGSFYHFINIPENTNEKKIEIIVNTVFPNRFKTSYEFKINEKNSLILEKIESEALDTFLDFSIFSLGFVIVIISVIESKNSVNNKSNKYLGLVTIMFAAWSSSFLFTNFLIMSNQLFIYYLNYFSLFFFSILLICYIDNNVDNICLKHEYHILLVTITLLTILHILRIFEYAQSIKIFIAIFISVYLEITAKIISNMKKTKKMELVEFIIICILILIPINDVLFLMDVANKLTITRISITILASIYIYIAIKRLIDEISLIQEAKTLKEIAYKDNLTKTLNRYALDSDLKGINIEDICFVSLDLNNLKYYNDNFGHSYGDKLILEASEILKKTYGNVYRIGGDEFLVLLKNKSLEELFELKQKMKENVDSFNAKDNKGIFLEIASGYSIYDKNDKTYEDILRRADKEMYKDKRYLKSKSTNK